MNIENFKKLFKMFLTDSNIEFNDKPILVKQAFEDFNELASWEEIEYVLNSPNITYYEIIKNGIKLQIPKSYHMWDSEPKSDHKIAIDEVNSSASVAIMRWEDINLNARMICKILDDMFNCVSSSHLYCGLEGSESFNLHCDMPSNFIFQIHGKTQWKVYSNYVSSLFKPTSINDTVRITDETCVLNDVLVPGDLLYIPSRILHQAIPLEERISISFPCAPLWGNNKSIPDRNYYELNYKK